MLCSHRQESGEKLLTLQKMLTIFKIVKKNRSICLPK